MKRGRERTRVSVGRSLKWEKGFTWPHRASNALQLRSEKYVKGSASIHRAIYIPANMPHPWRGSILQHPTKPGAGDEPPAPAGAPPYSHLFSRRVAPRMATAWPSRMHPLTRKTPNQIVLGRRFSRYWCRSFVWGEPLQGCVISRSVAGLRWSSA